MIYTAISICDIFIWLEKSEAINSRTILLHYFNLNSIIIIIIARSRGENSIYSYR